MHARPSKEWVHHHRYGPLSDAAPHSDLSRGQLHVAALCAPAVVLWYQRLVDREAASLLSADSVHAHMHSCTHALMLRRAGVLISAIAHNQAIDQPLPSPSPCITVISRAPAAGEVPYAVSGPMNRSPAGDECECTSQWGGGHCTKILH